MILHGNVRLYIGRCSFSLPNDVYIDTMPDISFENVFKFSVHNGFLTITITGKIIKGAS